MEGAAGIEGSGKGPLSVPIGAQSAEENWERISSPRKALHDSQDGFAVNFM
jgi:hypothetical protein